MKAYLITYDREDILERSIIDVPDDYDGNPYGDTLPFCVGSNQRIEVIDDWTDEATEINHRWDRIETELNSIAWHLQVAKESELPPDPTIIARHLRAAKEAYDWIDNFCNIYIQA